MNSSIDSTSSFAFQSLRPELAGEGRPSPYASYNNCHRYKDQRVPPIRCPTLAPLPLRLPQMKRRQCASPVVVF